MKHYKRTYNGRFISKEQVARRELRKLIAFITLPVALGVLAHYVHTPIVFDSGWEPRTAEAHFEPHNDPCELRDVVCEDEKPVEKAVEAIPHNSPITTDRIRTVYRKAHEAGVSGDILMHIAWCESMLWNQQSNSRYDFDAPNRGIVRGEQERSYGWFMLHVPDHPHVTPEQALDISFAVEWAIEQVKQDKYPWYGYDAKRDVCANPVPEYW